MFQRRTSLLCLAVLTGALASIGAPRPAAASLVLAMDLAQLTTNADRVVVGEILSVESKWDDAHKRIFTMVQVHVAETWKGPAPADGRVVIVQPGGSVGDIEMRVHGMPQFTPGVRAVLFLRGLEQAQVVGLGQGRRAMRFESKAQRWIVDGGDRSAAVNLDGKGGMRPAKAELALPLDDLRKQVRALVRP
jgi:hypothetical protein